MERREYTVDIVVNDIFVKKVIIDPHYEERHRDKVNDEIILGLVQTLDGETYEPVDEKPPYQYFVKDKIYYKGKFYKLIWLLEEHQIYVGIVNAHRRS